MNMQETPRVWRTEFSKTLRVIRPFNTAAMNAATAPSAELSTREVQPLTKGTIITKKITKGNRPALSNRNFSGHPTLRSSLLSAGPSLGLALQRIAM